MDDRDPEDGIALRGMFRAPRRSHEDIEAQIHDNSAAPERRDTSASDNSTTSSATLAASLERRKTSTSSLERRLTWQVEEEALHGYPKLADLVGNSANFAIYRSFKALNARTLLYQQAKIAYLEHELNDLEKAYESLTHLHWKTEHLFRVQEPGSPGHKLRSKHEEIATELKKFNHMLLEQAQIHKLETPDASFVDSLWNFIMSEKRPAWMDHPENAAYAVDDQTREPIQKDLVTLNSAFRQQDPFTRFFTGTVMLWWHYMYAKFRRPDDDLDFYVYSDHAVSRYMRAIVMIIAAALPTCSIVALSVIDSEGWRLGFIVAFSGLFAAALSFFTEAKSIEVFTASVALASVQVVFVGTAFGNNQNNT